jgi:hypothetical protein
LYKYNFVGDEHPELPAKNDGPGVPGFDPSEKKTPWDFFWIGGKRLPSGNDHQFVDLPIKNGDFLSLCDSLPEGNPIGFL